VDLADRQGIVSATIEWADLSYGTHKMATPSKDVRQFATLRNNVL